MWSPTTRRRGRRIEVWVSRCAISTRPIPQAERAPGFGLQGRRKLLQCSGNDSVLDRGAAPCIVQYARRDRSCRAWGRASGAMLSVTGFSLSRGLEVRHEMVDPFGEVADRGIEGLSSLGSGRVGYRPVQAGQLGGQFLVGVVADRDH